MIFTNEPFPSCKVTLSSDDVRIIRAFHRDMMRSYVKVAKELSLSPRTIKRRITKLSDEEALYLVGEMQPKFATGYIVISLLLFYETPEKRQLANENLLNYIGDRLLFANLDDSKHGYFALVITNIAQAKEILRWAFKVPGISGGRVDLTEDIIYRYEVYEQQLVKLERNPILKASRVD